MNLSDGGFLNDPEGKYAKYAGQDVIPFEEIADRPCLALLGEPGVGKTTVVDELRSALDERLTGSGDQLLYLNLNEYGEESRLIRDLFECEEFTTWRNGTHVLHLFLDSLDECRIRIPQVAKLLSNRFQQVRDRLGRLRLRIACRTADWPATLESMLPQLWGSGAFGAYELAFLRRRDVEAAARAEGIDPEAFTDGLAQTESVPLAIKPVTLKFLLSVFRKQGELPNTRAELYEKGCTLLCEEQNAGRLDLRNAGGTGALSTERRLAIASRIAAVTVFCGKPSIFIGTLANGVTDEQTALHDLADDDVGVSERDVRETLGTGLFSSRGPDLMGFSHQTYAEFLAARYLLLHRLDTAKTLAILQHSGDRDGGIVPQLYQAAAWIAGQNAEVFTSIARNEPQILLRCDRGTLTERQRAELCESLLNALNDGRANDRDWDLHRHYVKLDHPGLGEELLPWIVETDGEVVARSAAIRIAEACKVAALQASLADLALNQNESERLRSAAAHALASIGDAETRRRLRPLAFGQGGNDPDDDLKGNALRALWPDSITSEELFGHLTLPRRSSYHGAYLLFVEHELAKHLNTGSLPRALRWLREQTPRRTRPFPFSYLADDIFTVAWRNIHNAEVAQSLAQTALELLKHHCDWIEDEERIRENQPVLVDVEKRHQLTKAIVNVGLDDTIAYELVSPWCGPRLLHETDLDWCLDELLSSVGHETEASWANLAFSLLNAIEPRGNMLDRFVDARAMSPELEKQTGKSFMLTLLDSKEAEILKERYERSMAPNAKNEPKPLDWLPRDRIEHWLARYEKGEHNVWWRLLRELTLEDTSKHYRNLFEPDVTSLPGWKASGVGTHERILDAARVFLEGTGEFDADQLLDGQASETDIAPYKAFLLLLKERPADLDSLPEDRWAYWVPVLFGPFGSNGDRSVQRLLIGMAYRKEPDAVLVRLQRILERQIAKGEQYLTVLDLVEDIWDEQVCEMVRGLLESAEGQPLCYGRMVCRLLTHGDGDARGLVESKLDLPLPQDAHDREVALRAAVALVGTTADAAWSAIWPILQGDPEFGRSLMMEFSDNLRDQDGSFFSKLDAEKIADLFIWLVRQFPYSEDPVRDGVHTPTQDDSVRHMRTSAINWLEGTGTPAACQAITCVSEALPEFKWLKSVLVEARKNMLRSTWRPMSPRDLLRIISEPNSYLVRDASELQALVVDTLCTLEVALQGETPAAPDLWDERSKGVFRPKDENHLSDWVKRHLDSELKKRAVVIAREVEIRRGEGAGVGESTDIHVTASVPACGDGVWEQVRVIIETKGCWHSELKTAMKTQLTKRYLKDNSCQHGIYLVGWYVCEQWDADDGRRARTPRWSLEDARNFFNKQAGELSATGPTLRAIVLNAALR